MKRYVGILILCIAGFSSVSAATLTATITEIAGKVEYKLPGKDWQPAQQGDTLVLLFRPVLRVPLFLKRKRQH